MDQEGHGLGNPAKLILDNQSTITISHFSNENANTSHFSNFTLPGLSPLLAIPCYFHHSLRTIRPNFPHPITTFHQVYVQNPDRVHQPPKGLPGASHWAARTKQHRRAFPKFVAH